MLKNIILIQIRERIDAILRFFMKNSITNKGKTREKLDCVCVIKIMFFNAWS